MTAGCRLYPLLLKPVYKDYIWGGNRIARLFHREVPGGTAAESWEVADRPEGMSVVLNGSLAGKTLGELVRQHGAALIGRGRDLGVFPLLVKIIDAAQRLSVQVHPDETSAREEGGGEAKTEAWVVLDAEPCAMVYAGFKRPSSEAGFREAIIAERVDKLLNSVPARRGDVMFVPGGRIHCIGKGCLMLEIQQNSNTTYRLHDWGRLGSDGKPRELHLEEALKVVRWDDTGPAEYEANNRRTVQEGAGETAFTELLRCPYFRIERALLAGKLACATDGLSFHILFVETDGARVSSDGLSIEAGPGTSVLVPAGVREYRIEGRNTRVIRISI